MARMTHKPKKHLMLFSGRSHPALAEAVAAELDVTLTPTSAYDFANGEIFVRFEESVRGCDAFVLQSPHRADQQVDHGAADHDRRAQARLGQADHRRRCRSTGTPARTRSTAAASPSRARLIADLFKTAGADRLIVGRPAHRPDPGLLRRPGRPPVRPAAARRPRPGPRSPARRSPWSPRTPAASAWPSAGPTCSAPRWPSSTSAATRTCPTRSRCSRSSATSRAGSACVVDDMIDTGGTIVKAAETLLEQGAKEVVVAATHGDPVRPGRRSGWPTRRISRGHRHQHAADHRGQRSTSSPSCRSPRCWPRPSRRSSPTAP